MPEFPQKLARSAWWMGAGSVLWACLVAASGAQAQDERPMSEPIGFTDVADAFDEGDPLDVNVEIGFRSAISTGTIQREVVSAASANGQADARHDDVLTHDRVHNELIVQLQVGLFRDVMVFAGLPLVLGDSQELTPARGGDCGDGSTGSCAPLLEPTGLGTHAPLFSVQRALTSKQRSGLARVDLGAAWAVLNQHRGADATWVLRATLGLSTSDVMAPCVEGGAACGAGIAEGFHSLTLESRWSRRFRYVEPLLGLSHRFAWLSSGEDRFTASAGYGADDLPTTTAITAGAAFIPWEDRMRHQRFSVEARGSGAYVSAGRGYSPLFDALGTSTSPQLASPPGATEGVPFTGVTSLGAHGRLGFEVALSMQAARYVRFMLGLDYSALTTHLISGASDCAPGEPPDGSSGNASRCLASRTNPSYRPVIDAPGQRFRLADATTLGLVARAIGQF